MDGTAVRNGREPADPQGLEGPGFGGIRWRLAGPSATSFEEAPSFGGILELRLSGGASRSLSMRTRTSPKDVVLALHAVNQRCCDERAVPERSVADPRIAGASARLSALPRRFAHGKDAGIPRHRAFEERR